VTVNPMCNWSNFDIGSFSSSHYLHYYYYLSLPSTEEP
jgi:hypothetical protein